MTFLVNLVTGFLGRKILFALMMSGLKQAVDASETKVDDRLLAAVKIAMDDKDYMEIFKDSLKEHPKDEG